MLGAFTSESAEAAAARLHEHELVIDLHNDVNLDVLRSRARGMVRIITERYLPRWRQAGLDLVVLNSIPKIGLEAHPYVTTPIHNMLAMLDAIRCEIDESDGALALVTTAAAIDAVRAEGRLGIVIGVEGAEALGTHMGYFRMFHALGLRVLTLTWHQRNLVADGVSEPSGSGLSNLGREVVQEADRLGVLLHVSHASPRTVLDVLEHSSRPIVASHSNARALHDHERNLPDELVRAIAERGGVIGVVFIARFVAEGRATIDDVVRHVLHLCEVGGPQSVALGPDYVDGCHDLIIDSRRVAGPHQPIDEASIPFVEGLEGVEGIPDLTAALLRAGLDEVTVTGILGRNAARVLREVLP